MENYETIGIAVRQHDAIRLSVKTGELATYYIAAADAGRLFDGAYVPLYSLRLTGDYVEPAEVPLAVAHTSSTGRMILVYREHDCLQIPTRQLQVHYERDLGETSKIVRKVEGVPSASPAAATAPAGVRVAVV